jgi:hypothetical protein
MVPRLAAQRTDGAFHAIQSEYNGASSANYIDGTLSTGIGISAPERLVPISTSARSPIALALYWTGKFLEAGLWPSDKTANNALMNSKQHTYRGAF